MTAGGAAARDGRLRAGVRLLEVNNCSLLGASQEDAADLLRRAGAHVHLLICDGFDPSLMMPAAASGTPSGTIGSYLAAGAIDPEESFASLKVRNFLLILDLIDCILGARKK